MPIKDPIKRKEHNKKYYFENKEKCNLYSKKYYEKNKEIKLKKAKEWKLKNKERCILIGKKWREKNKEKCILYSKEYYEKNKEIKLKKSKEWSEKNKERHKQLLKNWYQKNKKQVSAKRKKRYGIDPNFKIRLNVSRRILLALKGEYKSANTMTLLGISNIEILWAHLEKQFKPGMTRENHGLWHIDHVLPCSSFDLTKPEEQAKCFHYTNLQPLWASENLSKGNRIS